MRSPPRDAMQPGPVIGQICVQRPQFTRMSVLTMRCSSMCPSLRLALRGRTAKSKADRCCLCLPRHRCLAPLPAVSCGTQMAKLGSDLAGSKPTLGRHRWLSAGTGSRSGRRIRPSSGRSWSMIANSSEFQSRHVSFVWGRHRRCNKVPRTTMQRGTLGDNNSHRIRRH